MFFEDVLSARVAALLQPMLEKDGFVADLKTKTFHRAGASATSIIRRRGFLLSGSRARGRQWKPERLSSVRPPYRNI